MSVVQSKTATGSTSGTPSVTLDAAPTNGNTLVVFFSSANSGTVTGPSGFAEDFNTTSGTTPSGAACLFGGWHLNAQSGHSATVSVTLPTAGRWALVVLELSAVALDSFVLSASASSSSCAATGLTPRGDDTVLAVVGGPPTTNHTPTWNDGFAAVTSAEITNSVNGAAIYVATKTVTATTATGTVTAAMGETLNWRGAQLAYTSGAATVAAPVAGGMLAAPPPAVAATVSATVALPPLTFTFTAPVPTIHTDAAVELPVLEVTFTARVPIPTGDPAPDPAPANGIERLTAAFYDPTGRTRLNRIGQMNGAEFRAEVSQRGNGKLRIPLDDAEHAAYDNIVKFAWRGHVRFGCLINNDACELAVNGRAWLDLENLPGLLALLDWADIAPEYGLDRKSSSTRRFGAMSRGGAWLKPEEWDRPIGVAYNAPYPTNSKRHTQDQQLLAARYAGLQWISPAPGPNVPVPGRTIAHFRAYVDVVEAGDYAVITTGDDYTEVYGDGEQLYASDRSVFFAWRQLQTIPVSLTAGKHLFASTVENKPGDEVTNVLAFVFALIKLDSKGNPTGDPILVSNDTDWICTTATVGWHKGYLIGEMLEEAQDRGIPGALALTATFTDTHDSNGEPWSTDPGEYACDIETTTLADLIVTMCESGINAHVNAANNTLNLYNRMGSDKYGTVEYKLAKDGGSLLSYKTAGVSTRATSVTVHLDDDTWEQVDDDAGLDAVGRREVGYSLGTATNASTARKFGREQLAETAKPQHQFTAKASTQRGPQFYDDVDLGDSVKGPAHRGAGVTKIRALAVTVAQNGQKVDVTPDFMEDLS